MAVVWITVRLPDVTWAIEIDAYLEIIKARHLGERDIVSGLSHLCPQVYAGMYFWLRLRLLPATKRR